MLNKNFQPLVFCPGYLGIGQTEQGHLETAVDFHNLVDTDNETHISTEEPVHTGEHTEAEPLFEDAAHIEEGIEGETRIVG